MGREKYWKERNSLWPVSQHHIICQTLCRQWGCMVVSRIGSTYLLMMWQLIEAAGWILAFTRLFSLFSEILQNWLDSNSLCKLIITQSQLRKALKSFSRQINAYSLMGNQFTWPKPDRPCFSDTAKKTECRETHKQAAIEGSSTKGLAEYLKGENTAFGDGIGSWLQAGIDCNP